MREEETSSFDGEAMLDFLDLLHDRGDHAEVVAVAEGALTGMATSCVPPPLQVEMRVRHLLMSSLSQLGDTDRLTALFEETFKKFKDAKDTRTLYLLFSSAISTADTYWSTANADRSNSLLRECIAFLSKCKDPLLQSLSVRAIVDYSIGLHSTERTSEAIELLSNTLQRYANDVRHEIQGEFCRAAAFRRQCIAESGGCG